jgi:hypothetical protein
MKSYTSLLEQYTNPQLDFFYYLIFRNQSWHMSRSGYIHYINNYLIDQDNEKKQ